MKGNSSSIPSIYCFISLDLLYYVKFLVCHIHSVLFFGVELRSHGENV